MPSVTDYDLIVVDEAHRGYILDKEMSETEMLYRNQDDYISKYRTVIEDNCFIGSRSIVVEGAHVCREAVLGSNTVITGSTHIIDVTGSEPVEYKGYVPPRSVVVSGTYNKKFPAGEYGVQCALIIGRRKESTDKKTSLNDALRDFAIS